MAIDSVNAVLIGRVKDSEGFEGDLLEDPQTGQRMIAYTPEVWWQRGEYLKLQQSKRRDAPDNTPRHAWPGRPSRKG